jgi:hypothetical protein
MWYQHACSGCMFIAWSLPCQHARRRLRFHRVASHNTSSQHHHPLITSFPRSLILDLIFNSFIMLRWHALSCERPDIFVQANVPRCRTCNTAPNLEKYIAEKAQVSSFTLPPLDEELGEMNLYWPSCVPWTAPNPPEELTTPLDGFDRTHKLARPDPPLSFVYEETLAESDFRILRLSPAPDDNPDYPISGMLETYPRDECPEYETTSYMWAGEDGDNTACRPVFLGPNWDVLLQTRNCWNMLQYLRSRTVQHNIWVDAICINQQNDSERSNQVAVMGQIYRNCFRVVVYLGQDVVSLCPGCHRRRVELQELCRFKINEQRRLQPILRDIFSRKYFTRLWIIEELILSPLTVVPYQDIDIQISSMTTDRFERSMETWSWDDAKLPWMKHISKGSIYGQDLCRILQSTVKSVASDSRDKIFGVFGLLPDPDEANILQANYSISSRHCFIGICAYMLINRQKLELLFHSRSGGSPSWLPDLNSMDALPLIEDTRQNGKGRSILSQFTSMGYQENGVSSNIRSVSGRYWHILCDIPSIGEKDAIWSTLSVDSKNGSLSLRMINLLSISSRKMPLKLAVEGYHLCIETESVNVSILIDHRSTKATDAAKILTSAGSTTLFLVEHRDLKTQHVLVMQKIQAEGSQLLSSFECFGVWIATEDTRGHSFDYGTMSRERTGAVFSLPLPQSLYHVHQFILASLRATIAKMKASIGLMVLQDLLNSWQDSTTVDLNSSVPKKISRAILHPVVASRLLETDGFILAQSAIDGDYERVANHYQLLVPSRNSTVSNGYLWVAKCADRAEKENYVDIYSPGPWEWSRQDVVAEGVYQFDKGRDGSVHWIRSVNSLPLHSQRTSYRIRCED